MKSRDPSGESTVNQPKNQPAFSLPPIVYLISGLAADERIFRNLTLEAEVVFIPWLIPLHPKEPLPEYAERMAEKIIPGWPGIIAGVSFGGMVALEIASVRPWLKAVEISSINDPKFLPWHLRLVRFSGLYKIMPPQALKWFPQAGAWFFGTKGKTEYALFTDILNGADPFYMRWAINQLLNWKPENTTDCLQIIGTDDTIFPPRYCPGAIQIKGGTHLMVYSEAAQISQILNKLLNKLNAEKSLAENKE
ncbi:MAG: alpha/beta hydrolase [Chitinophagaceae bacterium]|nr:MAG: alpha/beta hydrolase [Chitinophagaceae bacterium]